MNGRDPSGDAALRQELEHLRARLQVLVDGSPLGIFFDDAEDRCVYVNRTFCGMMELTFEEADLFLLNFYFHFYNLSHSRNKAVKFSPSMKAVPLSDMFLWKYMQAYQTQSTIFFLYR